VTFADLVKNLDTATAPILVVLDKAGPQFMTGPNGTVQVFARDDSLLGFSLKAASDASKTTVTVPGAASSTAQQLAAAKAMIEAAGKEAAIP
jgi:hypothetical protein